MKEYKIIKRNSSGELEDEINNLLKIGWEVKGGVSSFYHSSFIQAVYHQAMTREIK